MDFGAALDYSQTETAQGTSGTSTGTFTVTTGGEAQTLNLSMSLEQSSVCPPIAAPQFIPGAGISSTDQAGIYNALVGDSENGTNTDAFNRAPMTGRTLAALVLIFY